MTRTNRTERDTATATPEAEPHGAVARADPRYYAPTGPVLLSASTEFVGCLLNLDPTEIAPLLDLVHDTDLDGQLEQHTLGLIRDLVARGVTPTCSTVLAYARTVGISTTNLQRLTDRLIDANFAAALPNAAWLAGVVLEEAFRRAGIEYAIRITQAAEERGLAEYEQVLGGRDELSDLWRRHRKATTGTDTPAVADTQRSGVA